MGRQAWYHLLGSIRGPYRDREGRGTSGVPSGIEAGVKVR